MGRLLMTYIGDDKILIWRTHHLIKPLFAAVTEPKDVIEHMVRVSCDRLDEWRFDVRSLECPKWDSRDHIA